MHTHQFPGGSDDKASAYNARDPGSIPGLGRSPGEGNGKPLQYSCPENPMDRGAWRATVHGVARVGHDLVTKLPPMLVHFIAQISPALSKESSFVWLLCPFDIFLFM